MIKRKLLILRRKILYRVRNRKGKNPASYRYFGMEIYHAPGDQMIHRAVNEGVFESDVVKTIRHFLLPDTTYLDIGANLGLLSVPFVEIPNLQIHSFEPGPNTFKLLNQTVASSGTAGWHAHELALGRETGIAEFHTGGDTDTALAGLRATGRAGGGTVQVNVTTLDQFWTNQGRPAISVIKIDVEGGEMDVLEGGMTCIKECQPTIILEIDPSNYHAYGQTAESIFDFIAALNYGVFLLPDYEAAKARFHQIHSPSEFRANLRQEINYLLLPTQSA